MLNGVMLQVFHWETPPGRLWDFVVSEAKHWADIGITSLWLPPAYKGGSVEDRGYGTYDLWDFGEFNQHSTVATRYGTRAQFEAAISAAKAAKLQVYEDIVFNHKFAADATEAVPATPVWNDNRNAEAGEERTIQAYTRFDFPGRGDIYSPMKWNHTHFDAVDTDASQPYDPNIIYRLRDKQFDTPIDPNHGNADYLMSSDLDMDSEEVVEELKRWGLWAVETFGLDGFRLDAVKHIRFSFFNDWLDHLRAKTGKELFTVGEYWESYDLARLQWYLEMTAGRLSIFDTILHRHFSGASKGQWGSYHMPALYDGTVASAASTQAVTFVENHDSQIGRDDHYVAEWFKPLAYAMILLREEGYPCIFAADYYGARYHGHEIVSHRFLIDLFLTARRGYAYGPQRLYFDHHNVVGWTRLGTPEHPGGLAVLLSSGHLGHKWMYTGQPNRAYFDLTGHISEQVSTNELGWGDFRCPGGKVSVWVPAP